jgi:hypothetical protein
LAINSIKIPERKFGAKQQSLRAESKKEPMGVSMSLSRARVHWFLGRENKQSFIKPLDLRLTIDDLRICVSRKSSIVNRKS